jgi:hypothetical protein
LHQIVQLAEADPTNETLAILLAWYSLENHDQKSAVETLSNASPVDESARVLLSTLAALLEGTPSLLEVLPRSQVNAKLFQHSLVYDLLDAAIAFTANDTAPGSERLFRALTKDADTTLAIIHIEHLLASLCLQAIRSQQLQPELIEIRQGSKKTQRT